MKRKRIERDTKPKPRPLLREQVRDDYGISDLELADLYNAQYGTSYSAPLSDAQVKEWYAGR